MSRPAKSRPKSARRWPLLLFLAGCAHVAPQRAYLATITRVEEQDGQYSSPTKGPKPFYWIFLEVMDAAGRGAPSKVKVLVLDLYGSHLHGKPSDTVSFRYGELFPASGEVWFEQLRDYRLVP